MRDLGASEGLRFLMAIDVRIEKNILHWTSDFMMYTSYNSSRNTYKNISSGSPKEFTFYTKRKDSRQTVEYFKASIVKATIVLL